MVSVLNFKYLILIQVQYDLDTEQVQKTRKDQCKNDFNKKYLFTNIDKYFCKLAFCVFYIKNLDLGIFFILTFKYKPQGGNFICVKGVTGFVW